MDNITFTPPAISDLKDMLNKSNEQYGDKVAYQIKNKDGSFTYYTYKDVYSIVEGLGTSLVNMGLKGKKIAIIGGNCFEWEIAYLSIVCGTGIVVPIDKTLPENELKSVIERSGVNAIFYTEKYREVLTRIKFSSHNNLRHLISMDVGRILRTFKIKKNVEVTDNGKIII